MKLLKYHIKYTVLPVDGEPYEAEIILPAVDVWAASVVAQSVITNCHNTPPAHVHTIEEDTP